MANRLAELALLHLLVSFSIMVNNQFKFEICLLSRVWCRLRLLRPCAVLASRQNWDHLDVVRHRLFTYRKTDYQTQSKLNSWLSILNNGRNIMRMSSELSSDGSEWPKVRYWFKPLLSPILGILLTLSIILGVGFTNGALPNYTLAQILPFIPFPEFMAGITVINMVAGIAIYKLVIKINSLSVSALSYSY